MSKNKVDFSKGIYDARQLGTPRMLLLGFQHMFAMFGATVLVPLITGLDIATTLLMACAMPMKIGRASCRERVSSPV